MTTADTGNQHEQTFVPEQIVLMFYIRMATLQSSHSYVKNRAIIIIRYRFRYPVNQANGTGSPRPERLMTVVSFTETSIHSRVKNK